MKNTILIYDTIECKQFIAEDYTSKKIRKILSIPELQNSDFIEFRSLENNQTIEQVSNILYGSPDFWDLLITINNIDPLFGMCYDFDILDNFADDKVTKYLNNYSGIYKSDTYSRLKTLALNIIQDTNESNRSLKIIKPEKLYSFLTIYYKMED